MADPGNNVDGVGLDLHTPAPAISLLTAPELVVDGGRIDGEAGRNAFDNCRESLSVRFAGCGEFKKHKVIFIPGLMSQ